MPQQLISKNEITPNLEIVDPILSGNTTVNNLTVTGNNINLSSNSALIIPKGTTAQQPTVPSVGMLRYNTSTNSFEGYSGETPQWGAIGGSASGIVMSGGDVTETPIAGCKIHRFVNTGTFTVTQGGEVEILLVGGGGSAGGPSGAGGGGGGVVYCPKANLSPGIYTVTIGAGGSGGSSYSSGGDSTITQSGSVIIVGDSSLGGKMRMRARGGGHGAGPHGGSPTNGAWGGCGGGGNAQSQRYYTSHGVYQFAYDGVITNGGTGFTSNFYVNFSDAQTNYSGLQNTANARFYVTVSGGSITSCTVVDPGDGYSDEYNVLGSGYYFNTNTLINSAGGGSGAAVTFVFYGTGGRGGWMTANNRGLTGMGGSSAGQPNGYPDGGIPHFPPKGFDFGYGVEYFGAGGYAAPLDVAKYITDWASFSQSPVGRINGLRGYFSGGTYYYGYPDTYYFNSAKSTTNPTSMVYYGWYYGYGAAAGAYTAGSGSQGICIIRYKSS